MTLIPPMDVAEGDFLALHYDQSTVTPSTGYISSSFRQVNHTVPVLTFPIYDTNLTIGTVQNTSDWNRVYRTFPLKASLQYQRKSIHCNQITV